MLKISIIMPVYNAEKYLHRAINSILSQTMREWELILINDGSTDSSASICEKYSAQDQRIKVIHKKNEGVAIARQIGINHAMGKYSIHADADDWIEPEMLEVLYNKAEMENIDFIILDYYINSESKQIFVSQEPTINKPNEIINDILENKLFGALWNKFIKTNLYKRYNVKFFYGINYCEDVLVCAQILKNQEVKTAYLNKAFYHYTLNANSITNNISRTKYEMRKQFQIKLNEILVEDYFKESKMLSSLSIFVEGFMNNCLTNQEIKDEFKINCYAAFRYVKSPRWFIGYLLIRFRCYKLAHLFIRY